MKGENKLLFPINGIPMIDRICKSVEAADFNPVFVVTGFEKKSVRFALKDRNVEFIHNRDWQSGMSTSIKKGISSLPREVSGSLIVLGDMPFISTLTLLRLKSVFEENKGKKIIYPTYHNHQANPVLFPKRYFVEILSITGDRGCKSILECHKKESITFPVTSDEVVLDCDTKEDYLRLLKKAKELQNVAP